MTTKRVWVLGLILGALAGFKAGRDWSAKEVVAAEVGRAEAVRASDVLLRQMHKWQQTGRYDLVGPEHEGFRLGDQMAGSWLVAVGLRQAVLADGRILKRGEAP